jgi:hypothetical protein
MEASDLVLRPTIGVGLESESKTRSGPSLHEFGGSWTLGSDRSDGRSWLGLTVAITAWQ